jgi:hypothetical protein
VGARVRDNAMQKLEHTAGQRADKPSSVGDLGAAPAETGGFRATLDDAALWDLVQMSCGSRARRAALVRSGVRSGYLYFADGQLVHATVGDADGEQAALDILSWRTGTWQSCDVPWPARPSIQTPWQGLLLRAAQIEDEKHRPEAQGAQPEAESAGASYRPADFEHTARIDARGEIVAGHGRLEQLAALAAYVCRVGDLIGGLMGEGDLIALDGTLAQGVDCLVFRKHGGDTIALRPRAGVDLGPLRSRLSL